MTTEANVSAQERIGQVIDERYRLVEHIADGGMASVYRAEHVNTGAPFAVKVLHSEFSGHAEMSARFQREVQASRSVQHPNVVAATDFGRLSDGCLFMVLEYIKGQDLQMLLEKIKPLEQKRAVKIALQVSRALVAAHAVGVIHRDLKPENIMLVERDGDPDYVKVVDFGIAKMPARGQALTALGSIFGTPDYMAPEQARGSQVDHRSDLYTLGTVLYEMLAGKTPFASPHVDEVILAQLSKPPPPLPATIDAELAGLVMQLLAKNPADRVQSAAELTARLEQIFERISRVPAPVPARAQPVPEPQPAPVVAAPAVSPAPRKQPAPAAVTARPQRAVPQVSSAPAISMQTAAEEQVQGSTGCQVFVLLLGLLALAGLVAFLFYGR